MPFVLFVLAIFSLLLFILSCTELKIKLTLTFLFFEKRIAIALVNFNCIKWYLDGMMNEIKKADIWSIRGRYTYEIISSFAVLLYSIFILLLLHIY